MVHVLTPTHQSQEINCKNTVALSEMIDMKKINDVRRTFSYVAVHI